MARFFGLRFRAYVAVVARSQGALLRCKLLAASGLGFAEDVVWDIADVHGEMAQNIDYDLTASLVQAIHDSGKEGG